jgi:tetratricopeptide (TPR) repeat protein
MNTASFRLTLPAVLAGIVLSASLAFAAWAALRSTPSLEQVGPLARAGRFDLALRCVDEYLRTYPANPRAHLMAAELALNSPKPRPKFALVHLRKVVPDSRGLAAAALLDRGKAAYLLKRYDRAETCWLKALARDPLVPEAAWALLDLYYQEGRNDDARRLAIRQYAIEPDRQDAARMLLELVRQDAEPVDPASVVIRFEPAVWRDAGEFRAAVALGLALIHTARVEEGVTTLRDVVRRRSDDPDAWDALLTGLNDGGLLDELLLEVARIPSSLEGDPKLERHLGRAAHVRRDWTAAAAAYRRAWEEKPHDVELLYLLDATLRGSGGVEGARELEPLERSAQTARSELRALYAEAAEKKDFGKVPDPDLYRRLAENRERLNRRDEARAWHLLILRDFPADRVSKAEAERLK